MSVSTLVNVMVISASLSAVAGFSAVQLMVAARYTGRIVPIVGFVVSVIIFVALITVASLDPVGTESIWQSIDGIPGECINVNGTRYCKE